MTPHQQPELYVITRDDLEEFYDSLVHVCGKEYADNMWACIVNRNSHSSQQSERDKVLDNIMDLVDARIEGLDDLLSTPPEQRTESAQDKYLKEARFELGLVQDEYKELRSKDV